MFRTHRMPLSAIAAGVFSAFAAATGASVATAQTIAGTSGRMAASALLQPEPAFGVVTNGIPCGQDETEFMTLRRLPEGLALLRMRSELEAAARLQSLAGTRQSLRGGPPVLSMQREVDSLARVVRSVVLAAPRRGEAAASEMAQRRAVTTRVRALAPQVDQAVEYALARVARPASAAPSGYMGVTVSSVPLRQSLQDGYIVSYCEYPLIVAVDPGSPAERSGLQAGDTILAFNGQDVRSGMVDYTALLTPDATVRVRAQRDGRAREFSVRVGSRPDPTPVRVFARTIEAAPERFTGSSPVAVGTSSAQPAPVASGTSRVFVFERSAPNPPAPPVLMSLFTNSNDAMLFGAQLKSLGNDLRVALSLPEGVLVLQVLRGTPAADAGLRDGDVILSANGQTVRAIGDIRDAFDRARGARSLSLRVARRNDAERTLVMRW